MNRKILLVIAALLILWGLVDFYHYIFIGREMLVHYAGVETVRELVNNSLMQGAIKTAAGLLAAVWSLLAGRKGGAR